MKEIRMEKQKFNLVTHAEVLKKAHEAHAKALKKADGDQTKTWKKDTIHPVFLLPGTSNRPQPLL